MNGGRTTQPKNASPSAAQAGGAIISSSPEPQVLDSSNRPMSGRSSQPSILSAPRSERRRGAFLAFVGLAVLLTLSIILNIVLASTSSSKSASLELLERKVDDQQKEIDDLKGRLREQ